MNADELIARTLIEQHNAKVISKIYDVLIELTTRVSNLEHYIKHIVDAELERRKDKKEARKNG